jgi:SH3-like domain-containing protein
LILVGITYYTYMGVYYQRVPTGYMVVAPPVGAPPPAVSPSTATVSVVAAALNVRQGPGANYPVLFVVNLGDTLNVLATSAGWLYVQTATGQLGWVDQRFTSPLTPGASG